MPRLSIRLLTVCIVGLLPTAGALAVDPPSPGTLPSASADRRILLRPASTLSRAARLDFRVGQVLFERIWVTAPSSTRSADGLGPLYSARSCHRCHPDGGRGRPLRKDGRPDASLVMRIDIPESKVEPPGGPDADRRRNRPEPTYGSQLQAFAIPGHPAESGLELDYTEIPVTLADGAVIRLRSPEYRVVEPGYGPLHPKARLSPRLAPQMIGLGLLDAIDAADILAGADPDDLDGDGISGRPNRVWSHHHDRRMPGRFGHKAGMPTLRDQVEDAFVIDLGLSTPSRPAAHGDCTAQQTACLAAPHGDTGSQGGREAGETVVRLVTRYLATLALPPQRDPNDGDVLAGRRLFHAIGCATCHRPSYTIDPGAVGQAAASVTIRPYTDLLLHDMGAALADGRPEGLANEREWRTPPLWGVGLVELTDGSGGFLHDGRARSLLEAILWHGGEARAQRDAVVDLSTTERRQLLRFVASL